MKTVKLSKQYRENNPGEICGFDDDVAAMLIAKGHAEPHIAPEPAKAEAPSKQDDKKPAPQKSIPKIDK